MQTNTTPQKERAKARRRVPFLNLSALMAPQRKEYEEAFKRILDNPQFIKGGEVAKFEEEFGQWVSLESQAVGCANGTDAIRLAVRALNLPPGAEVIVPAMTFIATVEPLVELGLNVRLVDVSDRTWVMDVEKLKEAVSPATRLIVPVHLYGQMAPMDEIRKIADENDCYVLEDSAQAHGATWKDKAVGNWGDLATYSFFPGKNLGAFGDAGAVLSNKEELVEAVKALGNHGGLKKYQHDKLGYNSRLDTLQAAILRIKLKHIDQWTEKRRWVASRYQELLSDIPYLTLPLEHINARAVYHLYVVLVEDRNAFREFLSEYGVGSGIHYPKAIHEQAACAKFIDARRSFPNSEKLASHGVSIPMCPTMTEEDVQYVSEVIHRYYEKR